VGLRSDVRVCLLGAPFVSAIALAAFFGGCGPQDGISSFSDPTNNGLRHDAGTDSSVNFTAGNGAGEDSGVTANDISCSEAAMLVYVVSDENDLYSFAPATLAFTKIGTLACPSDSSPNSMAVDRSGTAWVNYGDGSIFEVSTKDATCAATNFAAGQFGFTQFGMGFSANEAGSPGETLFVCGESGLGLATVDTNTWLLSPLGDFYGSLQGSTAELTGTGDARLYGFFTTNPASLAEITKASSDTPDVQMLPGVETGTDWAFSFWGGDFWFYTADETANPNAGSKVTQLHASTDNSIEVVVQDTGFRIVGAGVSTCAPTSPVK
jgi:hypothetical protein